jgi:hypothetical protein
MLIAHHDKTVKVILLQRVSVHKIVGISTIVRPLGLRGYLRNTLLFRHVMEGRVMVTRLQWHWDIQIGVAKWMPGIVA